MNNTLFITILFLSIFLAIFVYYSNKAHDSPKKNHYSLYSNHLEKYSEGSLLIDDRNLSKKPQTLQEPDVKSNERRFPSRLKSTNVNTYTLKGLFNRSAY